MPYGYQYGNPVRRPEPVHPLDARERDRPLQSVDALAAALLAADPGNSPRLHGRAAPLGVGLAGWTVPDRNGRITGYSEGSEGSEGLVRGILVPSERRRWSEQRGASTRDDFVR